MARLVIATMLVLILGGCAMKLPPADTPETALGVSHDPAEADFAVGTRAKPRAPRTVEAVRTTTEAWPWLHYEGVVISSPHFRIHTTIDDERLLKRLPLFYEQALAFYTSAFGELPQPDRPLETYLLKDRRQWRAKTQQLLPEQAADFETLGRGGLTTRGVAVLYFIDWKWRDRDTLAIAAHEGWHQYTQTTFRQHLPIWLEEGLATYVEGYRNDIRDREGLRVRFVPSNNAERLDALRRGYQNETLAPLNDLLGQTPQKFLETSKTDLLTYYAQVWALIRFLVEGEDGAYRPALEQVIDDAAQGRLTSRLMGSEVVRLDRRRATAAATRLGTWVAREYFNADLAQLNVEYHEYIKELVGPQYPPRE